MQVITAKTKQHLYSGYDMEMLGGVSFFLYIKFQNMEIEIIDLPRIVNIRNLKNVKETCCG